MDGHESGWRNAKHRQQWRNTLCTYAYPILGHVSVAEIDTELVLKVLQQQVMLPSGEGAGFWRAKPETASRVRGRMRPYYPGQRQRGCDRARTRLSGAATSTSCFRLRVRSGA